MEAVLAGMIGTKIFSFKLLNLSGLSLLFFFIIYAFDIKIQKNGENEEKEKSEVLDSMIGEVKPKKKKLRTFDVKKWETVRKELELRKKLLPRTDEK